MGEPLRHVATVDDDLVARPDTLPDLGGTAIHQHATFSDPRLDLATRADAVLGQ